MDNAFKNATIIEAVEPSVETRSVPALSNRRSLVLLFLASFLALYFELVVIRYLATEIRAFAYLKNLPLIASFFGLGLGMAIGKPPQFLKRYFSIIAAVLFLAIAEAPRIQLWTIHFPGDDYFVWGLPEIQALFSLPALRYFAVILGLLALVVAFFVVLGGVVGERLSLLPPLPAYGTNLAGSLAGIITFTLLAYAHQPPVIWLLVGCLAALPFFYRPRVGLLIFALTLLAVGWPPPDTYWSPYYGIKFEWLVWPSDQSEPAAYELTADHIYHQRILNLSPDFIARHPDVQPNRSAFRLYELPYRLVPSPNNVLIVGAGTGNDVASALRHGAGHVDAVEIDPVIYRLGKQYHPEHPYDSPRVTVHLDDARAFFKKADKKYDLIVFGLLDSLTMLTGYSSVRLDNYVYTVESFREARSLLRDGGSLALGFAVYKPYIADRLFATLTRAFDTPPRAFHLSDPLYVLVEGPARNAPPLDDVLDVTDTLSQHENSRLITTDRWPFLYLQHRTIPQSIIWVLLPFLGGAFLLLRRTVTLPSLAHREYLHLFLLGAGFLLLETKGVTELALLFGSTWVVNALVIGSFLVMAILANTVVMYRPIPFPAVYSGLLALLAVGLFLPYSALDTLPTAWKVLAAGGLVGLPVFFSGLIFSRSFQSTLDPAKALGVNLLGAVIGGALENTVMLAGTTILGALAIVLYGLSAVFVQRRATPVPQV